MSYRKRKIWSVKGELLIKSREAMLCAVQIFNIPNVVFKSESFIVLTSIAWTSLLHSFYKEKGIDYDIMIRKTKEKGSNVLTATKLDKLKFLRTRS